MAAQKVTTKIEICLIILAIFIHSTNSINLGLFAGDKRKISNPVFVKKVSKNSPVFININHGLPKVFIPTFKLPKLPPKPPPIRISKVRKLPRSLKNPFKLSTKLPKLPLLTTLPPLLPTLPIIPPILPPLPLLPRIPLLLKWPRLPKLRGLKPLKVPIVSKSLTGLGSEPVPVTVIPGMKKSVMKKLLQLKRKGSLNTKELLKFMTILSKI